MPDQISIQNVILASGLQMANEVEANRVKLVGGLPKSSIDWTPAQWYYLNITALQWQLDLGDYTSDTTIAIYDCLLNKIGFDTDIAAIDPNFQPNDGIIVVVNPASYIEPRPSIPYSEFDPITQQPDGGRYIYYQPEWITANPVLSITSPVESALNVGIDYTLISTGGISLIPGVAIPGGLIYPGDTLRATSYKKA